MVSSDLGEKWNLLCLCSKCCSRKLPARLRNNAQVAPEEKSMHGFDTRDSDIKFFKFSFLLNSLIASLLFLSSIVMKEHVHLAICLILTLLWGAAAHSVHNSSHPTSWLSLAVSAISGVVLGILGSHYRFAPTFLTKYRVDEFYWMVLWYILVGLLYPSLHIWFARRMGDRLRGGRWLVAIQLAYSFLFSYSFFVLWFLLLY